MVFSQVEFDELMRSGTTMKVSLTPDRLKSFEVCGVLLVMVWNVHSQLLPRSTTKRKDSVATSQLPIVHLLARFRRTTQRLTRPYRLIRLLRHPRMGKLLHLALASNMSQSRKTRKAVAGLLARANRDRGRNLAARLLWHMNNPRRLHHLQTAIVRCQLRRQLRKDVTVWAGKHLSVLLGTSPRHLGVRELRPVGICVRLGVAVA